MIYSFNADAIDLGIDDTEEVYTITFTQVSPNGGPAENYLKLERSVEGLSEDDGQPNLPQPFIELNDPSNGRYASAFKQAELTETRFSLDIKRGSSIATHPGLDAPAEEIERIEVSFSVSVTLLRKLKRAMILICADGLELAARV